MKAPVLMLVCMGLLVGIAVIATGCIDSSQYHRETVTVYSKINNNQVCTDKGIYKMFGPTTGSGSTSGAQDAAAWTTIPIGTPVTVGIAGDRIWWPYPYADNQCCPTVQSCQCTCCNQTPTPTPTPCCSQQCRCC